MKLQSLIGQPQFEAVLRQKPIARYDSYTVHLVQVNQKMAVLGASSVCLGMIVPKKAYALAVDRNRVRRVVRSQLRLIFENNPHYLCLNQLLNANEYDIHCVIRIKSNFKKVTLESSGVIPSNKKNQQGKTPKQRYQHYLNPHSQAFTQCIQRLLQQSFERLLIQHQSVLNK